MLLQAASPRFRGDCVSIRSGRLGSFIAVVFCCLSAAVAQPQATENSDAERYYNAGRKALSSGDFDEARKDYEMLAKLSPGIAEVHATLGAIYFQQKNYSSALNELHEASRLKPGLPKLDGLISMSLSELGRYKEALPGLETTFRSAEDAPVKRLSGLQLERAYTALHQDAEAVRVALELETIFPNDPEILYHNERTYGNQAFLSIQKLAKVAPDSVWRHQAQAEALESQGSHDAAITEYRRVLALDPQRAGIHYRVGRCLRAREHDSHQPSDLAEAMKEFAEELRLDPRNANAAYEIGEVHRLAGELEPARQSFELALKAYPDFPEANLGLATVLSALHKPTEALPYLKRAIANDPDDEASWYRMSQVQRSLGNVGEQRSAMREFQRLHERSLEEQLVSPRDVTRQDVGPTPEK